MIRQSLLLLSLLSTFSCLDEVDLTAPKGSEDAVVIDSRLLVFDENPVIDVSIARLFNFTGTSREFVRVASIRLVGEDGFSIEIPSISTGFYSKALDRTQVSINKKFQLQVDLADGRKYESTFEPILPVPPFNMVIDTIEKEIPNLIGGTQIAEFLEFQVNVPLFTPYSDEKVLLYWESIRDLERLNRLAAPKRCESSNSLIFNEVSVFDGKSTPAVALTNYPVYERRIDFTIREIKFCLSVVQLALDQDGYDYWQAVAQNQTRTGSILENPPGTVPSNFININDPQESVFGYFYASEANVFTF